MGEIVASSEEFMELEEVEKDSSPEVMRWERFLPRMVLRVLLVEADDSTRQIITALLRKCNYKVAAVSDGLKAWEILKGRAQSIDLILTEVDLPSISGYALLTLIMEHETCKNIPVIMMSSQDSISVVWKCMMKGAADFLIKPVRRNELKNLWQHVWRRQTQTVGHVHDNTAAAQHRVEATSENNAASNHSSDYLPPAQNNKECSEKACDAQGLSQRKCESASNLINTEKHEECVKLVNKSIMPHIVTEDSSRYGPEGASCEEAYNSTSIRLGDHVDAKTMTTYASMEPESRRENADVTGAFHCDIDELVEPTSEAIDLIGKFESRPTDTYGHFGAKGETTKFAFAPQLELSLRRFHPSCSKNEGTDERSTLNHSNASAFSWYNNSKTSQPLFAPVASTCTEPKECTSTFQNQLSNQLPENIDCSSQWHGKVLSTSQNNMSTLVVGQSGQADAARPSTQLGYFSVPGVRFDSLCSGYSQILPPIFYTQSGLPHVWGSKSAGQQDQPPFSMSALLRSDSEVHNSERGYCMFDETTNHSSDQTLREEENNKETMEVMRHGSLVGGSLCNGVASKLNRGVCGSICNSSDQDATSATAVAKTTVSESVNDNPLLIRDGSREMDSHCPTQREAALMKFRLKRKERCYEKKVRYQSRKRLAEQRPRVKGQFVRQVQSDSAPADTDGCL
ncbi:two-component response regulator-like PRR95 isoform X2 [Cornus florida]|uniref:two-component response regulator-like PRR95 isoform X2 n=1 Tax=Cornus florida TaxID=4283 RepID=UPI0028A20BB8|nr:two-component response regulator-like PRR95 isoform X2 [Cornus florida]